MAETKDTKDRAFTSAIERLKQRATEAQGRSAQKAMEAPRQLFLPGFDIGAFPNHQQTEMVTRKDCVLEYTGEQLDEADGDLIMALIAFAQPFPLGTPVPLNRKELLRKIKHDKVW